MPPKGMKPAFTKVTIESATTVRVEGPIEFDDNTNSAYFWVRVTQGAGADAAGTEGKAGSEASTGEAIGLAEIEFGSSKGETAPPAPPEMWQADATVHAGEFKSGDVARVEAWALVRTPTKVFHVYWQDDAVQVEG